MDGRRGRTDKAYASRQVVRELGILLVGPLYERWRSRREVEGDRAWGSGAEEDGAGRGELKEKRREDM